MFSAATLDSGGAVSWGQGDCLLRPHSLSWGMFLRGLCALRPRMCPGTLMCPQTHMHSLRGGAGHKLTRAHMCDVTRGGGSEELAEWT